ncbi:hypothetical protein GKD93_17735 [Holdemania massiliensis]|uniref:Uncharacterized protein n=2 Tax=Holdemania massiliensis TaxID=1468449 RepID=A0A6N7SBM9_9FIRM|nr:hypothetical protein [Holdemania massiliensis]MSA72959.1 hypothetical protein [Holdemania massiliensis]MSA91169.1 hypothetical protein [Holdemania massiliensis]MSB80012.1 hypothetical protein [Holdemania massiliensis]MSC34933.1 hypothetical protein [Holdemania massiliensis]MSC41322.1 hypothetical protein [Holdemania massiliensis]
MQDIKLPCFFITTLQIDEVASLKDYYRRGIPFVIDYLPDDRKPNFMDDVYQVQDAFGLPLRQLTLGDRFLWIKNKTITYDREQKVLHVQFMMDIRQALDPDDPDMQNMTLEEGVKEDEHE